MKITRRYFLQTTGALAAYCGVAPLRALGAAADTVSAPVASGKTLVSIFLRGGIDGLNLIVPYADPGYAKLRTNLRIANPGQDEGCLDLDGSFGLHPRARALLEAFDAGHAVAAHAVGYGKNSRSHFEEQDVWETGVTGNTVGSDGWLNRHLLTSEGRGPVRAVALGDALPRILRGDAPAYAIKGLSDLGLPQTDQHGAITAALEHAYQCDPRKESADATTLVRDTGAQTLEGMKLIDAVAKQPYKPSAKYPNSGLANQLKSAARLIKAEVGIEVIQIDYGGWDTHNNQGNGIAGNYGNKVEQLSEALAAFTQDLGDRLDDVLVLTLSDFGRTARENGTRGTDHGWANAMLALGGPVARTGEKAGVGSEKRRKVLTDWPGLLPDQLHQNRDLMHTTDFRDVLSEVVAVHLGNPNLGKIIPGHDPKPVGLIA